MTTVSKATHITISAANTIPTNVQVILQGQESPVATQSPGCVTAGKGTGRAYLPNRNDIGWQGVAGANSYNIYRAKNNGAYSLLANVAAATAGTNYTTYFAMYPAPAQTFGNYTNTQCGPASGINCAYTDNAATGIASAIGQAGATFKAVANITNGSTTINVTSVTSGSLTNGQGIGTLAGATTVVTPNGSTTANPTGAPATTAAAGSIGYIPLGTTIVSGAGGGAGTYVMSQAATSTQTGITIGEVAWGNVGYTYYVTAVTGGVESANSAFAYLPFITNGNLVHCNGAFDAYVGTQQTAPVPSPLGWTKAVSCDLSPGRFQSLNVFSGNSCVNYNLNTAGYNYLNISFCRTFSGTPGGGNAEICGDAPECFPNGTAMQSYGPSSWTANQWATYKMPINIFNTNYGTGVPQTAMYKITWGTSGPYNTGDVVYLEYWFSVT